MKQIKNSKISILLVLALVCVVLLGSSINYEDETQVLIVRSYEGRHWMGTEGIYLYYGKEKIEKVEVSKDYTESANDLSNVLNDLYIKGWRLISSRELDGGTYNGPNGEYILER